VDAGSGARRGAGQDAVGQRGDDAVGAGAVRHIDGVLVTAVAGQVDLAGQAVEIDKEQVTGVTAGQVNFGGRSAVGDTKAVDIASAGQLDPLENGDVFDSLR